MAALGFEILVPPVPTDNDISYSITGAETQVISFTLKPGVQLLIISFFIVCDSTCKHVVFLCE